MADSKAVRRARQHRRRYLLAGLVAVLILGIGSGVAIAVTSGSGTSYRVAEATLGNVQQTLDSVGTVSAANQATVSFPVSGTVAEVAVTVGQKVRVGQTLATLSATALQQQITSGKAVVATSQQTLATDEASQTATANATNAAAISPAVGDASIGPANAVFVADRTRSSAPTSTMASAAPSVSAATSAAPKSRGVAELSLAVSTDQTKLLHDQSKLDADLNAVEQALAACKADFSTMPDPAAAQSACLAAMASVPDTTAIQTDRDALAADENKLTRDLGQLTAAAAAAAKAAGGSGATHSGQAGGTKSGTATGNRSGSSGSSGTPVSPAGGSSAQGSASGSGSGRSATANGPATAAQLAADQAQLDAAQASLAVAEQALKAAVLAAPIGGTVAAVGLQAGKNVNAGSSTSSVTIIGDGRYEVITTVALSSVGLVAVGQPATVEIDGLSQPVQGKVAAIGVLSTTTGTSTSYPVTLLLDASGDRFFNGSGASVSLDIADVSGVLTVPSSAVHHLGNVNTVTVLKNGKTSLVRVQLGAVGSDRTQITGGLTAGQQVVLATINAPIPSSNTTGIARRFGAATGTGTGGALIGGTGLTGGTRRGG